MSLSCSRNDERNYQGCEGGKREDLASVSQKERKQKRYRGKCDDGEDMYKRLSLSIGSAFERLICQEKGECVWKRELKIVWVSLKTSRREQRNHLCSLRQKDWQRHRKPLSMCVHSWMESALPPKHHIVYIYVQLDVSVNVCMLLC